MSTRDDHHRSPERDRRRDRHHDRSPSPSSHECQLIVINVDFNTTDTEFYDVFRSFKKDILSWNIPRDLQKRTKGYGFISFTDKDVAAQAIEKLDKTVVRGRVIHLEYGRRTGIQPRCFRCGKVGHKSAGCREQPGDRRGRSRSRSRSRSRGRSRSRSRGRSRSRSKGKSRSKSRSNSKRRGEDRSKSPRGRSHRSRDRSIGRKGEGTAKSKVAEKYVGGGSVEEKVQKKGGNSNDIKKGDIATHNTLPPLVSETQQPTPQPFQPFIPFPTFTTITPQLQPQLPVMLPSFLNLSTLPHLHMQLEQEMLMLKQHKYTICYHGTILKGGSKICDIVGFFHKGAGNGDTKGSLALSQTLDITRRAEIAKFIEYAHATKYDILYALPKESHDISPYCKLVEYLAAKARVGLVDDGNTTVFILPPMSALSEFNPEKMMCILIPRSVL